MKAKKRIGIVGAAGYTGGELLRILYRHPQVELAFAQSESQAGKSVSEVHRDFAGELDLLFCSEIDWEAADLVFLCRGHGASKSLMEQHPAPSNVRIIDLSMDFRWQSGQPNGEQGFVYGLPELHPHAIRSAQRVANPGCFATAIQLALLPLAQAGELNSTYITGVTGSTGAGQQLQESLHFSWRANNISPYKALRHQHMGEIRASLERLQPRLPDLHFVPWRGDFTRGIFLSALCTYESGLKAAQQLYSDFFQTAAYTHLSPDPIDLKQVINTNKCLLHLEWEAGQLVIHCALDNLLKGAAGQAVQNMNLMFGWDETIGLQLKPIAF
jgi:N-acetyl-gamma-glutamyl-phosphate reductase